MSKSSELLAFDSCDYPGSPWKKDRHGSGRTGFKIDMRNAVWVPGKVAQDSAAETARRAAAYEAMFPHANRLR